jgi:aryl-alcohol dehydrogenase-like predicted oxidoreductase
VRYIGASNYSGARLAEALETSRRHGFASYVSLQPHYNLVERHDYEAALAPLAAEAGLGVLPYSALASGFLAGKYRSAADQPGAARQPAAARYLTPAGEKVLAALDAVAAGHAVEPATVALAWLRTRPQVAAPLASARTPGQLPALLTAASLELTADEVAALDSASAYAAASRPRQ